MFFEYQAYSSAFELNWASRNLQRFAGHTQIFPRPFLIFFMQQVIYRTLDNHVLRLSRPLSNRQATSHLETQPPPTGSPFCDGVTPLLRTHRSVLTFLTRLTGESVSTQMFCTTSVYTQGHCYLGAYNLHTCLPELDRHSRESASVCRVAVLASPIKAINFCRKGPSSTQEDNYKRVILLQSCIINSASQAADFLLQRDCIHFARTRTNLHSNLLALVALGVEACDNRGTTERDISSFVVGKSS